MDKQKLISLLKTKIIGQELYIFDSIDSTNNEAKQRASSRTLSKGTTFVAAQQTQGKGTDGNTWHSSQGNLYLSIVFPFDDKITTLFPFYPAVALAKVLRRNYSIMAHLKWPNDILIGNKKIAGILCEGISGKSMVMGIGINTTQDAFPKELEDIATSVALESSKVIKNETLFCRFLEEYEKLFYGQCNIREEWIKHSEMIGKTIETMHNNTARRVEVCGLSPEGYLQVKTEQGTNETWMARRGLDISANY